MNTLFEKFSAGLFSQRASDPAKALDSYEERFDAKIPSRLRDIMIEVGGAIIFDKPVRFKPIQKSGWEDHDGLVGMPMIFGPTDDHGSLVKSTLAYMDQLPSGVFPFAELRGGICSAIRASPGKYYFGIMKRRRRRTTSSRWLKTSWTLKRA